jgi:putative glutamine amidotransferase
VSAPLIAVVSYHLAEGRITKWDTGGFAVPDDYVAALDRAGGRAALLTGPIKEDASELLGRFDGVLLVGGGDVAPERYGTDRHHPDLYGVDPDRDDIELELTLAADAMGMPTLAVCRGAQVMNVAFGGSLHQHLPELPEFDQHRLPAKVGFVHEVKVAESSRLAQAIGAATLRCHSAHHQGLDRLGEGLTAVGWAEDGLVEAVERPEGWMVGVQWHPERTAGDDPAQQALFDHLVVRAGAGASA